MSELTITEFCGGGHLHVRVDNFIAAQYIKASFLTDFPLSTQDLVEVGVCTTIEVQAYELRLWLSKVLDIEDFVDFADVCEENVGCLGCLFDLPEEDFRNIFTRLLARNKVKSAINQQKIQDTTPSQSLAESSQSAQRCDVSPAPATIVLRTPSSQGKLRIR
jgi:hypothetical protein